MRILITGLTVGALLCTTAIAQVPAPVASIAPAPTASVAGATLGRTVTLSELGFVSGLNMKNLSHEQTLFFPVGSPEAVTGMVLRLPYRSAAAFEARRSILVSAGGRPLKTVGLPSTESDGVIEAPILPSDVKRGFVAVQLAYSGVSTQDRCMDERAAGDYLTFAPDGGLTMELAPSMLNQIRSVAAFAPPDVRIVLPAGPATAAHIAAAMTIAAGVKGKVTFGAQPLADGQWSQTVVRIGDGASPLTVMPGPSPQVMLGGGDPVAGARLWISAWRGLVTAPAIQGHVSTATSGDKISLRTLGGDIGPKAVVGRADWNAAFSLKNMPDARSPDSVTVQVLAPPDQSGASVVTLALNGEVIATTRASWPAATSLQARLPRGLVTMDNNLTVSVIRQPRGGDCKFSPQGYPAQLLGSSGLTLAATDTKPPSDFYGLPSRFAGGVTLRLPSATPESLAATLPLAALAVQRLVPAGAPIKVTFGQAALDGPFIAIGGSAPAEAKPAVRFDAGRLQLSTSSGRNLFDMSGLDGVTTAQLVQSAGHPGLWLRQGARSVSPEGAFDLDRGDVAFVDKDGVAMAFSSTRDELIQVDYPDRFTLLGWLGQNRVWVILGVWLAGTAAFVVFLQRLYRNRRRKAVD